MSAKQPTSRSGGTEPVPDATVVRAGIEDSYHHACLLLHAADDFIDTFVRDPFRRATIKVDQAKRFLLELDDLRGLAEQSESDLYHALTLLRAAFDPPCEVCGVPQHSYHEGLFYVVNQLLFLDVLFLITDFGAAPRLPGISDLRVFGLPKEAQSHLIQNHDSGVSQLSLGTNPKLATATRKRWRIVRDHLREINLDVTQLRCALDKEAAKAMVLLAGPLAKGPQRWSKVFTIAQICARFDVGKNKAKELMEEYLAMGISKRFGSQWQIDEDCLASPPGQGGSASLVY